MTLWTESSVVRKRSSYCSEGFDPSLEDAFNIFEALEEQTLRSAKYIPATKEVIDLTNEPSDPMVEFREATDEFEALTAEQKAATAEQTMKVYPAKAATCAPAGKPWKSSKSTCPEEAYERKKRCCRARTHAMKEARHRGLSRTQQLEVGRAAYKATA